MARNLLDYLAGCHLRLEVAKQALNLTLLLHALGLLLIETALIFEGPMPSEASCWIILVSFAAFNALSLCGLCQAVPRASRRQLDLWFLVVTFSAVGHLFQAPLLETSLATLLCLRLPALFLCGHAWLLCSNGLCVLAVHGSWDLIVVEALAWAVLNACGGLLQWLLLRVEAVQAVATHGAAASSLLRFVCDAVVLTDEELTLLEPSPNLGAMLHLNDTLEGVNLMDLMTNVEGQRTTRLLDTFREQEEGSLVNAFHTRLVNGFRNKVGVDVLMVKYMDCHRPRFFVGLREQDDGFLSDSEGAQAVAARRESLYSAVSEAGWAEPFLSFLPSFLWGFRSKEGRSKEGLKVDERCERREVPDIDSAQGSQGTVGTTAIAPTCRQMFLEVDVAEGRVRAASAGLQEAVGMGISELFPAPHTAQLLQRLHQDAERTVKAEQPLAMTLYSFNEMPMSLGNVCGNISGTMQVMKSLQDCPVPRYVSLFPSFRSSKRLT